MKITACYLLFVSVVTFELAGRYVSTVTASREVSEDVPSTHMPRILSEPTTVSVSEGDNVTFRCHVDDLGGLTKAWKNDHEVFFLGNYSATKDPRITLTADMSLHIENVRRSDAGVYTCQITTFPPLELHHELFVKSAPSAKTIPESGFVIVKLGDPLTFGCDSSGIPPPTITWTRSMKELTEHANKEEILIQRAKKEHAGIYECKVDNGVDVPALGKIEVNVHYKPYIEAPTKLVYTGDGVAAEISCTVYGEPPPLVTWLKDNARVTFSQEHSKPGAINYKVTGGTHTLRIGKVTRYNLGVYTCKAINRLGSASEVIEVTGVPAPVEFKYSISDKPDSYSMKWSVKSNNPIIEFKLKFRKRPKNGEEEYEWTEVPIPAEKRSSMIQTYVYEITDLEPASEYEAVILPRNNYGWNNHSKTFVFKTEGAETSKSNENMVKTSEVTSASVAGEDEMETGLKTSEVTSSSVADTRTNSGSLGSLSRTAQILTVLYIVVVFLW